MVSQAVAGEVKSVFVRDTVYGSDHVRFCIFLFVFFLFLFFACHFSSLYLIFLFDFFLFDVPAGGFSLYIFFSLSLSLFCFLCLCFAFCENSHKILRKDSDGRAGTKELAMMIKRI